MRFLNVFSFSFLKELLAPLEEPLADLDGWQCFTEKFIFDKIHSSVNFKMVPTSTEAKKICLMKTKDKISH